MKTKNIAILLGLLLVIAIVGYSRLNKDDAVKPVPQPQPQEQQQEQEQAPTSDTEKPVRQTTPRQCRPVTTGVAPSPDYPVPTVCGYIPTCPSGQFLITSQGQGTWSDGSLKGTFTCSTSIPN